MAASREGGCDVAGHDQVDVAECVGRADRLDRAQAAVGRGGAAAADDDAPGTGVPGGEEQLAHAGRVGADGVVALGVGEPGAAGGL